MTTIRTIRRFAAVCVTLASVSALHAGTYTFNFTNAGSNPTPSMVFGSSPSGLSVTVTANAYINNSWVGANVGQYQGNGLGVTNSYEIPNQSPAHSIDSISGIDYIMFNFGKAVDVNSVSVGWVGSGYDSQFTYWLLNSSAWTNGLSNLATGTLSGGTGSGLGTYTINGNNTFAQYLVIAANGSDLGKVDAAFKVSGLNVTTRNNVPDGGSVVALVGASLLGLVAFRRRFAA